ncbi:MAG: FtsX-like permease family protein [Gammaproteobacteria bacterium]|nr:FtsX-like permease family protein [Gammaproteobacteria bacterium]
MSAKQRANSRTGAKIGVCRFPYISLEQGDEAATLRKTDRTLPFWVAIRYLSGKKSSLTYVSRLALFGLALSVTVLVVVLSVVNGFERELRERVLAVLPHFTLEGSGGLTMTQVDQLNSDLHPNLLAVAPVVQGTALISAAGKIRGVKVTGIDTRSYDAVTDLAQFLSSRDLSVLRSQKYGILLGINLAEDLGVGVGDSVKLILPSAGVTAVGAIPRQRRMEVVDIFASRSQLDSQAAYINLATAQRMFRTGTRVHSVQGRLQDLFVIQPIRQVVHQEIPPGQGRFRSWMSSHGGLYQAIAVQKLTMFVLLSFLVGVAAFNLVSGLVMIVEQRKQDVAVLRTLGASARSVMLIFCVLGLLLAVLGIGLGLVVGVALALALPLAFEWGSASLGLNLMTQYFISYLPVDVRTADLLQIGGGALLISFCSTIYPAWKATRLLPSEVLAHE